MDEKYKPIGVFDSGLGGLSVLKKIIEVLPNEDLIYYGDTKNAPYGTKTVDDVKKLSTNVVNFLINKNVKAMVVACNTATSAAINDFREKYDMPIIGIEPALKPAVELNRKGKIIIMATPITLSEQKFKNLMNKHKKNSEVISLPCPGLVEFIENGEKDSVKVHEYIKNKFKDFNKQDIAAIVLGCTHYPFVKNHIVEVLGSDIPIIDGSLGTAKQLKRQLKEKNLLNDKTECGNIEIYNSSEEKRMIDLSYELLNS